jgi:hypothetical protein
VTAEDVWVDIGEGDHLEDGRRVDEGMRRVVPRGLYDAVALLGVGQVDDERGGPGVGDGREPGLVDIDRRDACARTKQLLGHRLADPAACAGHDRVTPLEAHAGPLLVGVGAAPGWMTGSAGLVRPMRSYSRSGIASSDFHTVH